MRTEKILNPNKKNIFFSIRKCSRRNKFNDKGLISVHRRNKFNDKGLISVHRRNKGYSSTYNTTSISCHPHAIYYFDVL
jgi:hypothetical protein